MGAKGVTTNVNIEINFPLGKLTHNLAAMSATELSSERTYFDI